MGSHRCLEGFFGCLVLIGQCGEYGLDNRLIISKLYIICISIICASTIVNKSICHGIVICAPAAAIIYDRTRKHIVIPCNKRRRNSIITGDNCQSSLFQVQLICFFALCRCLFSCQKHYLRSGIFEINTVFIMEFLEHSFIIEGIPVSVQNNDSILIQSFKEVNIRCGIFYSFHKERVVRLNEVIIYSVINSRRLKLAGKRRNHSNPLASYGCNGLFHVLR
ncbi:hypothetical protein D3C73_1053010 [compost metagenome]